jgi:Ca2+-binding RTX toxin-like protein
MATYNGDDLANNYVGTANADQINGNGGNDTLNGTGGADTINGGGEDDILIGGSGGDSLTGGTGSDQLYSHAIDPNFPASPYFVPGVSFDVYADVDTLVGGDGNDYLFAGFGDSVDGGGNEAFGDRLYVSFQGATSGVIADFRPLYMQSSITIGGATIANIEYVNFLEGSNFDDVLAPIDSYYPFPSFVYGRDGDDHIISSYYLGFGGGGVYGGNGDDLIDNSGNGYGVLVYGEADNDHIIGGSSYESLYGGTGDDIVEGNYGFDYLYGEDGHDILDGGSFWDNLYGGAGNDTIYGAGDSDNVEGGDGNDLIYGDYSPILMGNGLSPSSNDDILKGEAGLDTIYGNEGNDILDGGLDADSLYGGTGDDTYVVDNVGDVVTEIGGEGTDSVQTSLGTGANQPQRIANMYTLAANVENLTGTGLNQGLAGNDLNNVITAGAGTDYIDASTGGSDTVNSGNGRDVIYYGAALDGSDANNGGDEGGDPRGDLLIVQGDYSAGVTLGANALVDIEKFRVLKGENTTFGDTANNLYDYSITTVDANVAAGGRLVVQGGSLQIGEQLTFNGSAETDGSFQLFGGRDADTLIGGAGDDHILGRAGSDTLTGNGGADRLRGGLGGDSMNGGTGADIFVYAAQGGDEPYAVAALESTSLNYDIITGFNYAEDRIDLPQAVTGLANVLSGSLSNASFDADLAAAVNGALNPNAAVLFTANAGDQSGKTFLIVDADNDGSYQANLDYVIQLASPTGTVPTGTEIFV